MLCKVTFVLKRAFPVPPASNTTSSNAPGMDAPLVPPDVVDQFAVLLQLELVAAIQYRCDAVETKIEKTVNNATRRILEIFMAVWVIKLVLNEPKENQTGEIGYCGGSLGIKIYYF